MTPAAVIPMQQPTEAIDELDFAVAYARVQGRSCCAVTSRGRRSTASAHRASTSSALESDYDYDPVWAKCVELGVAATFHSSAIYGSRAQLSNYVYNHIGVLAQGGEAICKALFMGGVTRRFPQLNFAFLEGGVGWAVSLYADLLAHWQRRNGDAVTITTRPISTSMGSCNYSRGTPISERVWRAPTCGRCSAASSPVSSSRTIFREVKMQPR